MVPTLGAQRKNKDINITHEGGKEAEKAAERQ